MTDRETGAEPAAAPCRLVAVIGPTATGKTDVALRLAAELGAQIVCVDSMQVYRGLDVGTAKPTPAEQAAIPHHGLDLALPTERFHAGCFAEAMVPTIEELGKKGVPVILCGGTGLYLRSLLQGLDPAPSRDSELRQALERRAREEGPEALHVELASLDPKRAAQLHPNDTRRVIRALEIARLSGRPPSSLHEGGTRDWSRDTLHICLDPGQETIRARIRARLRVMLREGLLEETAWLLSLGWERITTARQAVGYKEFVPYLKKAATLDDSLLMAEQHTARLAARQRSWFTRQVDAIWFADGQSEYEKIKETVVKHLVPTS